MQSLPEEFQANLAKSERREESHDFRAKLFSLIILPFFVIEYSRTPIKMSLPGSN